MTSPLVVTLPLTEGETLTGYVSRLAKLYDTTPRDFCSDLGMRWPALCTGHDDQLSRLAWLCALPINELKGHQIHKVAHGRYQIGHTQGTTGILRRTAGRLCPKCAASALEEQGPSGLFQLLDWSILCVNTCFKHACPLIQLPRSENSHTAYDFASRALEHRVFITTAAKSSTRLLETSFEAYVRNRVRKGAQNDWLKQLDLTHLHRCCLTLGASISGLHNVSFLKLSHNKERTLCESGFEHLIEGPAGLRAALSKAIHNDGSTRPYVSTDMGPFYRWLHGVHSDPSLARLVDTTRDHIFETYPVSPEKEIFGQHLPKQKLYTMADARKHSGLGTTFLKRLLGHLNAHSDDVALKRTNVSQEELNSAMAFWRSLSKLGEAASELGVLPEQVKKLQDIGVLKTVRLTSSLRYVEKSQINSIMEKVAALPKVIADSPTVSLRSFCRSNRLSIERVVSFWILGASSDGFFRGDGRGLHQIMVDVATEITREDTLLSGDLTVMETARFLKINVRAIRLLRDAGYLNEVQRRNPETNHFKGFITKASIQEFQRKFITLGQAADEQKASAKHLAQKLDRYGIEPIECETGYVRVYSISEWANLN